MMQKVRAAIDAEPAPGSAVEFTGVGVWRRTAAGRRYLLQDVDWRVEHGEHWGIVGPNGAGKTTLLRVASAQLRPSVGEATILGGRLGATSMPALRRRIGFVEQSFGRRFYPDQSVLDVVLSGVAGAIAPGEQFGPEERARAQSLLRTVVAAHLAEQPFVSCSEGERARVLLARALITDGPLLILDEPAAGLDLGGRELLLAVLADVMGARPGLTTLIVSHHLEELPSMTTHMLLLREAGVVAAGPIEDVATDERLSACFGLPLRAVRSEGRLSVSASLQVATGMSDGLA
jgi:iron complex transport system ATP-binding protein